MVGKNTILRCFYLGYFFRHGFICRFHMGCLVHPWLPILHVFFYEGLKRRGQVKNRIEHKCYGNSVCHSYQRSRFSGIQKNPLFRFFANTVFFDPQQNHIEVLRIASKGNITAKIFIQGFKAAPGSCFTVCTKSFELSLTFLLSNSTFSMEPAR